MALVTFHTQQLQTGFNHVQLITELYNINNPTRFLLGTAFLNSDGVKALDTLLRRYSTITTIYVGIRNGITSSQGLSALLDTGVTIYTIDTGTLSSIYHPKIYVTANTSEARIISGSANVTQGGLYNNIEVSSYSILDLRIRDEKQSYDDIINLYSNLPTTAPDNIQHITNSTDISNLLNQGRIIDESVARIQVSVGRKAAGTAFQPLRKMPIIQLVRAARPNKSRLVPTNTNVTPTPAVSTTNVTPTPIAATNIPSNGNAVSGNIINDDFVLVWRLPNLVRRHLQIPDSRGTHNTGTLSLTQANFENIDHTKYFRRVVFNKAGWKKDAVKRTKEVGYINIEMVIEGVSQGTFKMKVSHNTTFESGQRNYVTSLHWGKVKSLIAHEEFLGRELTLYRKPNTNNYILRIEEED